jgi:hypothetical protein
MYIMTIMLPDASFTGQQKLIISKWAATISEISEIVATFKI